MREVWFLLRLKPFPKVEWSKRGFLSPSGEQNFGSTFFKGGFPKVEWGFISNKQIFK
jgi:hypothetical protein